MRSNAAICLRIKDRIELSLPPCRYTHGNPLRSMNLYNISTRETAIVDPTLRYLTGATVFLAASLAQAQDTALQPYEKALAEQLTGSVLVGTFTVDGAEDGEPKLRSERYDLTEVRKLSSGKWLFKTRIRYGEADITVPITLPVEWVATGTSGPTAVVVVDKVSFPGAGTYSARVLFHGGNYAGRWSGSNYGGALFGKITKAEAE